MEREKTNVYSCRNCYLEFYYENRITHCPFCGNKLKLIGRIQENEIEGPVYTLKYSTGEKMQKKIEEEAAIKEAEESWYLWEE